MDFALSVLAAELNSGTPLPREHAGGERADRRRQVTGTAGLPEQYAEWVGAWRPAGPSAARRADCSRHANRS